MTSPHPWLVDLEATLSRSLQSQSAWMDLAAQALAESEVADQHEGRFLVELLQNVRDAWCMRSAQGHAGSVIADRPAHAALVVTDDGLLVADEGAGCNLHDTKVLRAVQYLRRSPKKGDDTNANKGLAGHKGIGLEAILRRCQAFRWRFGPGGQRIGQGGGHRREGRVLWGVLLGACAAQARTRPAQEGRLPRARAGHAPQRH